MRSVLILSFLLLASAFTTHTIFDHVKKEADAIAAFRKTMLELKDFITEFVQTLESTAHLHQRKYEVLHYLNTIHAVGVEKACSACLSIMSHAETITASKIGFEVMTPIAQDICTNMVGVEPFLCEQAIGVFGPVVMQAVAVKAFSPERACANLLVCKEDWERETLKEYIDEVLSDAPNVTIPKPTGRATYKAMHISDLHVDLFYEEGTNSECDYFICCRGLSGPAPNSSVAAGYWATPSSGVCDIPMRTVDQMLQYVARNFDIDYLIWTGDNIAHDIFYQSGFNLTEQTFVITQAIDRYLIPKNPNMMVFPIQGNHEGSPVNIFDYYNGTTAWITEELATIWSEWLDDNAVSQMNSTGYYSMYDPAKNLRVIALDTQACNTGNYLLYENPTDPYGQLAFVREQLYLAEANNETVFFIGHIPMAGGGCNYAWTTRFEALVERFSHIVRAQFYGHTHHDTFTVHRSLITHEPMSVQFIAPSMTTRPNIQPSFRIYEVDVDTNFIVDIHQYHLNASKWNDNHTGPIEWELFYIFTEDYGIQDMTFDTLDTLVDEFLEDPDMMSLYIYNVNTGYFPKYYLSEDSTMHEYCACKEGNIIQQILCLGPDYANYGDVYTLLSDDAYGTWRVETQ